jgi:hypothetical protein
LAHYWTFLKTITQTLSCVFPSLTNDTQIVGPLNEIIPTFDHFFIRLALVGLRVKVLKFKLWNSSKISLGIKILQGCTLIINSLCIMGVPMDFQDFVTHFLDEALF